MRKMFILLTFLLALCGCGSDFESIGEDGFCTIYWCDKQYGIVYIKSGHGLSARYDSTGLPLRCNIEKEADK